MRDIEIRGPTIRLGQLLKLAGLAGSGSEAKELLSHARVLVDGEPETRRGRQLAHGAKVELGAERLRVVGAAAAASGARGEHEDIAPSRPGVPSGGAGAATRSSN